MIKVSLSEMLKNIDSQYRLLRIAAMRTKQLQKGAKPRVEGWQGLKPTTIALREIAEGKVDFTIGAPPRSVEAEPGEDAA